MARSEYLFTSESVSEGHPDKVCDRISDEVVDLGLTYEEAGPFLLAKEIATIAGPAEAGRVSQFVAASLDEEGP